MSKCEELKKVLDCIEAAVEMDLDYSDKDEVLLDLIEVAELIVEQPKKRKRSPKRLWIKTWRAARDEKGSFKFLKNELLLNDLASFQNYLRMDKAKFDFLLELVKPDIDTRNSQMRDAVSAEEKLALTLRFLATGESFTSLNYQTPLSTSFISNIIPKVCASLWRHLKNT